MRIKWLISIMMVFISKSAALTTHECKRIRAKKNHEIGCNAIDNWQNSTVTKDICLNNGCCWAYVKDPKRRCFQERQIELELESNDAEHQWKDPSIHNNYMIVPTYLPEEPKISPFQAQKLKSDSKKNCLKSIEILTKLNHGKSCTKSVTIDERKSCDVSHVIEQDPTISSCTACIMIGCCFDPSFNMLSNNKLAPMCFNTTESFANKEE